MSSQGQRWKLPAKDFENAKNLILSFNATEDKTSNASEVWRLRIGKSVFTMYSSGTLYNNQATSEEILQLRDGLSNLAGSEFQDTGYEILMGLDETGKGELFGHEVLCGVCYPSNLSEEIKDVIGLANTKSHRTFEYWDEIFAKINPLTGRGLSFQTHTIPPWHIDKYNTNKIMDVVYKRIISDLIHGIPLDQLSIVLDNYQIGDNLQGYFNSLEKKNAKILVLEKADDKYIEAKLASILAKRERERIMNGINSRFRINGISPGSGNASNDRTKKWLEAWKESKEPWPWFVKKSYSTIRKIDGLTGSGHKVDPPIRHDLLSKNTQDQFQQGILSSETLRISCPECGSELQGVLITMEGTRDYNARCPACKKVVPDLSMTLQYYNGVIIPDTSAIFAGILSKDLGLGSEHFFENFKVLLHSKVYDECDNKGGRAELGRIGDFAATGRIKMEKIEDVDTYDTVDKQVILSVKKHNAIVLTADMGQYALGIGNSVFGISLKLG
jgi:ribonuclease HII